jgi:zinc protease
MKSLFVRRAICWAIAAIAISASAHATAQTINLPPIKKLTWPNGVRLYLMEYKRAPTISVTAIFPGGDSAEPPNKVGVGDLTAELLREGTATRTAPQIAEEIEFLGGSLSTSSGQDNLTVGLAVLSRDAAKGLDLFSDVNRRPTLPAEELERGRQLALASLNALREDPESIAARTTSIAVFGRDPYGSEATIGSIQAIQREDIVEYHRRVIAPDRMILIAVGDLNANQMAEKLRARFGDWPRAGVPLPETAAPPPSSKRLILVDKPDATQTQVRWARTALPRNHPDYFAASVAESILGGGFTSRLVEEIRVARSLTYGIVSGFRPMLRGGMFSVSSFTKMETSRQLIDATEKVLRDTASKGFTAAELKRVKGYLTGLFAISMQSPEALAGQLATMAFYGLPDDYLRTYLTKINAVTLKDANRLAKTYASPAALTLIVVGPASKIEGPLKGLGKFEKVSIETVGKTDVTALARTGGSLPSQRPQGGAGLDDKTKQRIDRWIKDNNRNNYGDSKDTMYAGGTPLFDERTGKTKDKYEYILEKHPELRRE